MRDEQRLVPTPHRLRTARVRCAPTTVPTSGTMLRDGTSAAHAAEVQASGAVVAEAGGRPRQRRGRHRTAAERGTRHEAADVAAKRAGRHPDALAPDDEALGPDESTSKIGVADPIRPGLRDGSAGEEIRVEPDQRERERVVHANVEGAVAAAAVADDERDVARSDLTGAQSRRRDAGQDRTLVGDLGDYPRRRERSCNVCRYKARESPIQNFRRPTGVPVERVEKGLPAGTLQVRQMYPQISAGVPRATSPTTPH